MRLMTLIDNNTLVDRYFISEPGLAFFIEDGKISMLFDVGYSGALLQNACGLRIDLDRVNYVILSHGHIDHVGGLSSLMKFYLMRGIEERRRSRPTLVAHPLAIKPKFIDSIGSIGMPFTQDALDESFKLQLSEAPVWITDRLVFLGEIPRNNDFEAIEPLGRTRVDGREQDDWLLDDSALAYRSPDGLVIITGCCHSGICNTIEYARKICDERRVVDIIGGLHLLQANEKTLEDTQNFLRELGIKKIHPCHCTDLRAKLFLSQAISVEEMGVGQMLEYK